jgi:hypothetical protein
VPKEDSVVPAASDVVNTGGRRRDGADDLEVIRVHMEDVAAAYVEGDVAIDCALVGGGSTWRESDNSKSEQVRASQALYGSRT